MDKLRATPDLSVGLCDWASGLFLLSASEPPGALTKYPRPLPSMSQSQYKWVGPETCIFSNIRGGSILVVVVGLGDPREMGRGN